MTLRALIVDVERETRAALVPILILQPLVENSIRHGLAARVRAERIQVRAMRRDERLILEVTDDGIGLGAAGAAREGVGLGNSRARLQALYGPDQSTDVANVEGGGVLVRLAMPWRSDHSGVVAG